MRLVITTRDVGEWAADFVAWRMESVPHGPDRPFVLGLPTGGTPRNMYRSLVEKYRQGRLSFRHAVTFNMDEYVGLPEDHPESYHYYMYQNFFNHVDLPKEHAHIPDGNAPDITATCLAYEQAIKKAGGIDLFVGGVGEDGHLAFNEPGSSLSSRTRDKELAPSTISANARFFGDDPEKVPRKAITVGIGTIMDAEEVLILVSGPAKAQALHAAIEGGISHMWPVSALQMHPRAIVVADHEAVQELKVKTVRYFQGLRDEYSWLDDQSIFTLKIR